MAYNDDEIRGKAPATARALANMTAKQREQKVSAVGGRGRQPHPLDGDRSPARPDRPAAAGDQGHRQRHLRAVHQRPRPGSPVVLKPDRHAVRRGPARHRTISTLTGPAVEPNALAALRSDPGGRVLTRDRTNVGFANRHLPIVATSQIHHAKQHGAKPGGPDDYIALAFGRSSSRPDGAGIPCGIAPERGGPARRCRTRSGRKSGPDVQPGREPGASGPGRSHGVPRTDRTARKERGPNGLRDNRDDVRCPKTTEMLAGSRSSDIRSRAGRDDLPNPIGPNTACIREAEIIGRPAPAGGRGR